MGFIFKTFCCKVFLKKSKKIIFFIYYKLINYIPFCRESNAEQESIYLRGLIAHSMKYFEFSGSHDFLHKHF